MLGEEAYASGPGGLSAAPAAARPADELAATGAVATALPDPALTA